MRIARVFRAVTTVVDPAAPIAACRPHPLDAVDWRLLELLERDGRASFAQLAPRIGLSQAACRARFVALLHAGVGHVAALTDTHQLGYAATAGFALNATSDAHHLAARIAGITGVHALAVGWGPYDILGEAIAPTPHHLAETLSHIHALGSGTDYTSWTVLHEVTPARPVGAGDRHRARHTAAHTDTPLKIAN